MMLKKLTAVAAILVMTTACAQSSQHPQANTARLHKVKTNPVRAVNAPQSLISHKPLKSLALVKTCCIKL